MNFHTNPHRPRRRNPNAKAPVGMLLAAVMIAAFATASSAEDKTADKAAAAASPQNLTPYQQSGLLTGEAVNKGIIGALEPETVADAFGLQFTSGSAIAIKQSKDDAAQAVKDAVAATAANTPATATASTDAFGLQFTSGSAKAIKQSNDDAAQAVKDAVAAAAANTPATATAATDLFEAGLANSLDSP
jgi:hypothetical protein